MSYTITLAEPAPIFAIPTFSVKGRMANTPPKNQRQRRHLKRVRFAAGDRRAFKR